MPMFRRKRGQDQIGRNTTKTQNTRKLNYEDEASFFVVEKRTSSALSSLSSISALSSRAATHHGGDIRKQLKKASTLSAALSLHSASSLSTGGASSTKKMPHKQSSVEVQKKWKKAQKGDTCAQYWLGDQYRTGLTEGIPQDEMEAFFWYAMAAEQGLAKAQFMLGLCYEKGRGVAEDVENAIEYYQLAADQGDSFAKARLEGTVMERFEKKKNDNQQGEQDVVQIAKESSVVAGYDPCTTLPEDCRGVNCNKMDYNKGYRQHVMDGASYMLVWRYDQGYALRKSSFF